MDLGNTSDGPKAYPPEPDKIVVNNHQVFIVVSREVARRYVVQIQWILLVVHDCGLVETNVESFLFLLGRATGRFVTATGSLADTTEITPTSGVVLKG